MEYPKIEADTLPKYLRLGARKWADEVYMRRKSLGVWQRWSWRDVYKKVEEFSLGLMKLGLERGETVAIAGENEPELFWAEFAALAAGAKTVCLYPDMTLAEVEYVVGHSESVYFIGEDQEQIDKFLEVRSALPRIRKAIYWDPRGMWQYDDPILMEFSEVQEMGREHGEKHPGLFEESVEKGCADDVALLSYTSGTTGQPKGVVLTHRYMLDNAFRVLMSNEFKPFTMYLSYLSPGWIVEHFFVAMGMIKPFIYNFPEEPETVLANIRELGAEALVFGPRQWESLASLVQARMLDAGPVRRFFYNTGMKVGTEIAMERMGEKKAAPIWKILHPLADRLLLRSLRDNLGLKHTYFALSGGAPASPDVYRFFHAMDIKLRNAYGSTEVGLLTQHSGEIFNPETMGKWYVSHPELGPPLEWKVNEDGGLLVRGGCGFAGYYKNEEATAEVMNDGWFITGDATHTLENGELVFLDRVKDLRRLATGYLFPPQFIETRLRFSPFIKDVMVLGDERKPFVSAMVNIDPETVGRWAEREGIAYSSFPDLSQHPRVCALINQEVVRLNSALDEHARVKRFVNLPKEFDPDEAELTRTRKLRRGFLEDRFGPLIEAVYNGEKTYATEVPVKYRDGRTGVVRTQTRINDV